MRSRPKRMLVAYTRASSYVPTTMEYLLALKNFTNYEVKYIHVTHDARLDFDINEFDVLFQNYCARVIYDGYVSDSYIQSVLNFRGLRVASVQDDYERTAKLHREIRRLGFHVLITPVPSESWHLVYPRSEVPGLRLVHALTGYMPERLLDSRPPVLPLASRQVIVAYRGRDIGARYGRLGFDKYEIGRRMAELCDARGIPHDIAMDEQSRIYGDGWFRFLGSSRAMLGSESGSNAFDFYGELEKEVEKFTRSAGRKPNYDELKHLLDPLEAPFDMGQISPRVFETSMMMTPMILYRGNYSGVLKPGVHYIPLEKDFSNAEQVLSMLGDLDLLSSMAERAYRDLFLSDKYGYRSFGRLVENVIEEEYSQRVDGRWLEYRSMIDRILPVSRLNLTGAPEIPTDLPLVGLPGPVSTAEPAPVAAADDELGSRLEPAPTLQTKAPLAKFAARCPLAYRLYERIPQQVRHKIRRRLGA